VPPTAATARLALIGAYNLYPMHELIEHTLMVSGVACKLWMGNFDNYNQEIREEQSALYAFAPDVVVFFPSQDRFHPVNFLTPGKTSR